MKRPPIAKHGPVGPQRRTRLTRKEMRRRFSFTWGMDPERVTEAERQDGVFP